MVVAVGALEVAVAALVVGVAAFVVAVWACSENDPKPPDGAASKPGAVLVGVDVFADVVDAARPVVVVTPFTVVVVTPFTVVVVTPFTVVVVTPITVVVVALLRSSWAFISFSDGSCWITGRKRSSAVWPTISSALVVSFTPGSCTTIAVPWRAMSGSATPSASMRRRMMPIV